MLYVTSSSVQDWYGYCRVWWRPQPKLSQESSRPTRGRICPEAEVSGGWIGKQNVTAIVQRHCSIMIWPNSRNPSRWLIQRRLAASTRAHQVVGLGAWWPHARTLSNSIGGIQYTSDRSAARMVNVGAELPRDPATFVAQDAQRIHDGRCRAYEPKFHGFISSVSSSRQKIEKVAWRRERKPSAQIPSRLIIHLVQLKTRRASKCQAISQRADGYRPRGVIGPANVCVY